MEDVQKNRREIYIDLLRILACFLVVVCHTNGWGFDKQIINANWFLSVGWYLISKTAVPVFFMISGALLLKKDYTYKQIVKKIIVRILIPLIIFSAVIYFKKSPIISYQNIKSFIWAFLTCNILQYYWFLYSLIALYIMTPFLRKMIKNFEYKDYIIFISIWILIQGIIPILEHYTKFKVTNNFAIQIVQGYLGYYILGYFLFNIFDIKKNKSNFIIVLVGFIIDIVISTLITYIDMKNSNFKVYDVFLDRLNHITIIIPSVCIVYIFLYLYKNTVFSNTTNKMITAISSTTFGIYLIHGVLIDRFKNLYDFLANFLYEFDAKIITQILIFGGLIAICYVIKKIPFINKII